MDYQKIVTKLAHAFFKLETLILEIGQISMKSLESQNIKGTYYPSITKVGTCLILTHLVNLAKRTRVI